MAMLYALIFHLVCPNKKLWLDHLYEIGEDPRATCRKGKNWRRTAANWYFVCHGTGTKPEHNVMRILATLSQISAVGLYCPPEKRIPGRVLHLWLLVIRLEVLIDTAFCVGKDDLSMRVVRGVKVTLGALRGQYYLGVISSSWYYTLDSLHHFNTERGEEKFATFRSGTEGQTGSSGKNNKGFVTAALEHFNRNDGIKSTVNGAYTRVHRRAIVQTDSGITRQYIENLGLDPEFNAAIHLRRASICA
jgi:hypothetical protein